METPDKIYLTDELGEITWCEDRINSNDVEYTKTSLIGDKAKEPVKDWSLSIRDLDNPDGFLKLWGTREDCEKVNNLIESLYQNK